MKNKQQLWKLPVAGSLMLTAAVTASAAQTPQLEKESLGTTNRLTGSIRFGLNIKGKFVNPGGSLNPRGYPANGRITGHGNHYNYDDGYVLRDVSGNAGNMSWYWGYDSAGQVNSEANTIDMHRITLPNLPSDIAKDDSPYIGAELTYDYQLGVIKDKYRYGVELAANYMPFNISTINSYTTTMSTRTDTYGYTSGTTPPDAPYYGSYGDPGFLINVPAISSSTVIEPGANLSAHYKLGANLWGFRLGPYIETSLTEKLSLHLTGGAAIGIVDADGNWTEAFTPPGGGTTISTYAGGHDTGVLWGFYAGADAVYQFNKSWGLDLGVQFQNLGVYDHNFGGRTAQLDLSQSVFFQAGISYSF